MFSASVTNEAVDFAYQRGYRDALLEMRRMLITLDRVASHVPKDLTDDRNARPTR